MRMRGWLQVTDFLVEKIKEKQELSDAHGDKLVNESDNNGGSHGWTVERPYADHKERFTSAPQVMCTQGFSDGKHEWAVGVGPESMWSLGLCYKSIPRRGDHSRLGHNSMSWRLQWKSGKLTVCNASSNVVLRETSKQPLKIELALDYEGGTLMFHSINGQREHLYTIKTEFQERDGLLVLNKPSY
ncbi:E3 ubiquitin-protein ligase TRIM39-like [Phyllopteryx taeniolatus]|uniref:E3 ubiquitin-protein ligase TRIM39-like n=1 Tax=Phyllopteryx taeniolatus TaxID=161469 RepID=UPI002AD3A935|nr:E3 ubiquitin-protein ligase TRIM39-like [Phyllopteryx taeniolatus]